MKIRHTLSFLLVVFWVSMSAAQSVSENSELKLGVQAYKRNKFEEAQDHFQKAVAQDPTNIHAHLYLATVYAQQYVPGVDIAENKRLGEGAIEQYRDVLDLSPAPAEAVNAVKGLAYLELQMKRFDEARDSYRKATELEPDDPESYYSIAVIDWTETYQLRQEERAKLNLKADASLPAKNHSVCEMVRGKNWEKIREAIDNLVKAIQLRPDYDDAMAYLNLMYRERADVQCDDPAARKIDLANADEWVDKTMAVKRAKAEKEQSLRPAPER
jgi:tetratricopeptide (TPR) repeat protein